MLGPAASCQEVATRSSILRVHSLTRSGNTCLNLLPSSQQLSQLLMCFTCVPQLSSLHVQTETSFPAVSKTIDQCTIAKI